MRDHLLEAPVIHCDETRLQVLKSDKAPTADHWMWVRAAGPPGRRIVLFDYDPSRGGAVPMRLFQGYGGILLTHAGCMAQVRRYFEDARKAHFAGNATQGHARQALDRIRELYLVERALWDRDHPVSPEHRVPVRSELSAPIMTEFHAWLEALERQVLPQSLLGKAVHYALGQWPKLLVFLAHGEVPLDNKLRECDSSVCSRKKRVAVH